MKKIILACMVLCPGFSASAQNTNTLLNHYIAVKNALVSSDAQKATETIGAFYQSVAKEESFAEKDELLKAAEKLNRAGSLEKQRASFKGVSTVMWKVVKGSGQVNQPVYYQYCPMKKAWWLSKEKEIKNPYYGSAMLTCGKVVETHLLK